MQPSASALHSSDWPRISVITPSYMQGRYVERTVRSVLLQRYPNLEYIVLDGGSTDETLDVLDPYVPQLTHFHSGPDGGQAAAIRRGFDLATGDILAYLNSDDLLTPGTLNFVADYFHRHPKVDAIYSHRVVVDPEDRVVGYWILPPHSNYLMTRFAMIPQETCFWRRSAYEAVGGLDPTFHFALDYDLFVRMMRDGRFRRVNRTLGAFRRHLEQKTFLLYESVGLEEVEKVQRREGIRLRQFDRMVQPWACRGIGVAGLVYQRLRSGLTKVNIPWARNMDELWNGALLSRDSVAPAIAHSKTSDFAKFGGRIPHLGNDVSTAYGRQVLGDAA